MLLYLLSMLSQSPFDHLVPMASWVRSAADVMLLGKGSPPPPPLGPRPDFNLRIMLPFTPAGPLAPTPSPPWVDEGAGEAGSEPIGVLLGIWYSISHWNTQINTLNVQFFLCTEMFPDVANKSAPICQNMSSSQLVKQKVFLVFGLFHLSLP